VEGNLTQRKRLSHKYWQSRSCTLLRTLRTPVVEGGEEDEYFFCFSGKCANSEEDRGEDEEWRIAQTRELVGVSGGCDGSKDDNASGRSLSCPFCDGSKECIEADPVLACASDSAP